MKRRGHPPLILVLLPGLLMITTPVMAYVGSDACSTCHESHHARWIESGHPYELIKIFAAPPIQSFPEIAQYPRDPVGPPMGYTWNDISYTIGGYGWKMLWIDSNGYIITGIENNQYNFESDTWSNYHPADPPGTKPYNCGPCHTTGWEPSDDGDPTNNQDGLEGMVGTFFAGGVHCEQCHGQGDSHVNDPQNVDMVVDSSSELCGQCHTRLVDNHIAASGGFIKQHEQYDEWLHSPHVAGPGCNTCHDPHSSVKFDPAALGYGTLISCQDCHAEQAAYIAHNGIPTCTDCHMPKASKSAVTISAYQGDLRTHIWSINTAPVGRVDGMFNEAGNLVIEDAQGQAQITLDFACYGCHQDEDGQGGDFSMKTLEDLAVFASNIHGTLSGIEPDVVPPVVTLTSAYPNPFNPATRISYSIPGDEFVSLVIYSVEGRLVKTLANEQQPRGRYEITWNGEDENGRRVASGTYLYRLNAGQFSELRKMTLVK